MGETLFADSVPTRIGLAEFTVPLSQQSSASPFCPNLILPATEYTSPIPSVLVPCGCYNKSPQTWWLETKEMYRLTVLEAVGLKSASLVKIKLSASVPPETWGSCSLTLPALAAADIPWFLAASLQPLPPQSHGRRVSSYLICVEFPSACLL